MYTVGFALLLGAAVALLMAWWRTVSASPHIERGASSPALSLPRVDDSFAFVQQLKQPLVWFVPLSALALLTHYNAVFIVAAWYLGWFIWALAQQQRLQRLGTIFAC